MKKTLTLWFAIQITLLTSAVLANPSSVLIDHDSLESKVDELFAAWDNRNSPGCALAVIKNGEIIYKRGYGMADLEHDIPISSKTVFYIGSTSKQFVAMCILLLSEQGKLSLDDDIRRYLPEFPDYGQPITIRHLIHHTSGIRDYLTLWELCGSNYLDYMPEEAVLDLICKQKELNFTPGEKFLYSNSGYFLLSVIVKRASGESLREFAQKNIFEPLGMKNTHFHDDNKHIIKNRAFGYTQMDSSEFGNLIMRFDLVGSGGLYTTVEDLYLWDQNFYHNKLGKSGQELINTMLTKGKFSNGEEVDYAFALRKGIHRGLKTVHHAGALGGYRAQLLRFPEQNFSVIILSNLASFNPTSLAYKVADIYLEKYLQPDESTKEQKVQPAERIEVSVDTTVTLTNKQLEEFAGEYYSDELQVDYKVLIENGQLFVKVKNNPKMPMNIFRKDIFTGEFKMSFQRDENDKIIGFILDARRVKNLKFLIKGD